jgi:hypothetical protein
VVATPEQVYNSVDADTVLTVLTHKITRAVRAQVRQQMCTISGASAVRHGHLGVA